MNPKVSIIIPIYNVSSYIEKCVHSLFNQTLSEIEYVFVNDATPDDSIEKLHQVMAQYPERINHIKIIQHPINRGSGDSKNSAIDVTTGNYIAAVDSDDYIEPEMMEVLYEKALFENADIVVSDMFMEFDDKTIYLSDYLSENEDEHFTDMLRNEESHGFFCNKLVRRSLVIRPDCRIPPGLIYMEDRHAMTRFFYFAKKIVKVDQAFYHYVHYNANAITKTKERIHFENLDFFWNHTEEFLKENHEFEKFKDIMEFPKVQNKINLMIGTHSSQLRKEFANMFYEEETHCLSKFRRGEKLMLLLVRYRFFGLAQLFHNFLLIKHRKQLYKRA